MIIWVVRKVAKQRQIAKNNCQAKTNFTGKEISDKEYEHVLKFWVRFEMKTMKDHYNLCLKCDVFLLAKMFKEIKNSSLKNYGLCLSQYLSD